MGDASPLENDGSNSDQSAEAPHEPAPQPLPAAMGNAGPGEGWGLLLTLRYQVELMSGNLGLDEGVAPGSGGAEVAPADGFAKPEHEIGSSLHGSAEVCVPAAPLGKNPFNTSNVGTCQRCWVCHWCCCYNPEAVGSQAYRNECVCTQVTVRHTLPGWTVCSHCRIKTQYIACESEG